MAGREDGKERLKPARATAPRPRAVARGFIFGGRMECFLLDTGGQAVVQRGMVSAITGASKKGAYGNLRRFLDRLPPEYAGFCTGAGFAFEVPIEGGRGGARVATGREPSDVVDFLRAYADALVAGKLSKDQEHLGRNAHAMISALAKVGIEAMIDEACGHVRSPAEQHLAKRFALLLTHEACDWAERFKPDLVHALAPLYNIRYTGGPYPRGLWGPFGRIYEMVFGGAVAKELRRRNPDHERFNHHQFLRPRVANGLRDELGMVTALAKQSRTKDEFWRRMRFHYRGEALQTSFI